MKVWLHTSKVESQLSWVHESESSQSAAPWQQPPVLRPVCEQVCVAESHESAVQTLASSQSASLVQQVGGVESPHVPVAMSHVPTVHGSPVTQSALLAQQLGMPRWEQRFDVVSHESAVQRDESAHCASCVQQPVIAVCWQRCDASQTSVVQGLESPQSALVTQHCPCDIAKWQVPVATSQVSIVQGLPSLHWAAVVQQFGTEL
jgi:hypothetical protein